MKYTYKLVPLEPTAEMVEAAEEAYMPFGDMDLAIRMAVLTAPDVQQPELAKYQPCGCVVCTCEHETQCQGCGAHHCGTHPIGQLYKPAYQQPAPDVAELVEERGDAMRFALPEVVAWWDGESNITRKVGRPAAHNWHQRIDLIRLSDYKALQAECEKLRKDVADLEAKNNRLTALVDYL